MRIKRVERVEEPMLHRQEAHGHDEGDATAPKRSSGAGPTDEQGSEEDEPVLNHHGEALRCLYARAIQTCFI